MPQNASGPATAQTVNRAQKRSSGKATKKIAKPSLSLTEGVPFSITAPPVPETSVLKPFHLTEARKPKQIAARDGVCENTAIYRARKFGTGRRIAGRWWISIIADEMLRDGNHQLLRRFVDGERDSSEIADYYRRLGVPLPNGSYQP